MSEAVLTLDEIRAILAPIASKYRVEAILLFDSYAKGVADGKSDVDLIVFGGSQFHPTDIFAMSEEIRSALRKQADVYEIREINPGTAFYRYHFPRRSICCMKYTDSQRIEKIRDYCVKLSSYISDANITRDKLLEDHAVQWAVTTPLYNIGEHTYNIKQRNERCLP